MNPPLTPVQIKQAEAEVLKEKYPRRILVGLDQFANILIGGHPDETISSRAQRAADKGNPVGKVLTGFLHLFQKKHGSFAEAGDLARADAIEDIEKKALDDTQ